MLTIGFLIALLIWPSWRRLWVFAGVVGLVSVLSVLVFAGIANTSDDSAVRAALFNYLVLYQGIARKFVNLATFIAVGSLIVWLRLGAKIPKVTLPNFPGALVGPFRLWVVCAASLVSYGAWRTVRDAPYLPSLVVEADTSQCAYAQFPDEYYATQLRETGLPEKFQRREQTAGSDFLNAPTNQYDFPHIPQLDLPAYEPKLPDILEAQRRERAHEAKRDEVIERLDDAAEKACRLRMKRDFDPAGARSEYRSALWSYWQDRATAIAPYLLVPFLVPAAFWLLWLIIRWVIRGFVRGSD